ncbi:MAG: right-handed parallel beta-helix repeat-containing protein [Thermodesulfobacteriota bacterium]
MALRVSVTFLLLLPYFLLPATSSAGIVNKQKQVVENSLETDPGEVIVGTAAELAEAVVQANLGGPKTILIRDGTYTLDDGLWVEAAGVTVRSLSGNRSAVIIQGQGMAGDVSHIFNVPGANFTVRDVTLKGVCNHAIQIHGNYNATAPTIRNVHILDTYEQMIKVSYDPADLGKRADNGVVEDCLLEYSAGIGPQWYIGGVDAHNARNWIVRRNIFRGIRSPSEDVAEFAIHFWSGSEDTLVERNIIINCDRAIGLGLGDRGHQRGIVRNNMIYHNAVEGFADVGIAVESAPGAQVYNNTIYQEHSYPHAIEYRFPATTGVLIANNLTNKAISPRDGATGTVSDNVTNAQASWFVNPPAGDLHLKSVIKTVVDQGRIIAGLATDFDGDPRPRGAGIDIGADEFKSSGALVPSTLLLLSD